MTDHDALLAAILLHPAEDTPRLMYADWLQENGQPERAAFVRVQVEYDRDFDPHERAPRGEPLRLRALELFRAHAATWFDGLPGAWRNTHPNLTITSADGWRYAPRRGFIAEVECHAQGWLAHGDAIGAAHPVTRVSLTTPVAGDNLPPSFFRGPFPDWQHVAKAFEVYSRLTGEFGAPPVITDREQWSDVFGQRWPGVAFELPAAPLGDSQQMRRAMEDRFAAIRAADIEEGQFDPSLPLTGVEDTIA